MANVNLKIRKPLPNVTITATVHMTREYRFRLWLGLLLLKLTANVLGCKFQLEKPDMEWRCPNCFSDLLGIMYERPWFVDLWRSGIWECHPQVGLRAIFWTMGLRSTRRLFSSVSVLKKSQVPSDI